MKFTFTDKKVNLPKSLHSYAEKKVGKLDRYFKNEAEETSFVPDVEENDFQVVRTKKFPIKPMTVDEAILQMDLLGHSFYAFKDEDGGAFAVVYKRNDGGYGLIEDEA